MFIDQENPERFPQYCRVCRKTGIIMPSDPLKDACCPFCGSLVRYRPAARDGLLPDTAKHRHQAEAIAAEALQAVDEMKREKIDENLR